jgi:riboflavin kinase/FMN adenylyltransferase
MFKTVILSGKRNIRGGVMLLGGFDGLHVGHRLLLAHAKEYALPVGLMTIVGGKDGRLFNFSEREEIFESAGVDFAIEFSFDDIKELSPQAFVEILEGRFAPSVYVCGEDFRFGKGAEGRAENLQTMTSAKVEVLPLLEQDGEKVSSSVIKRLLANGELEKANRLLGNPFSLSGTVITGKSLGRTIGFPTANFIYPKEKFSLPYGVYKTQVKVDGKRYFAITNFGTQPTVEGTHVYVETHIVDFSGNIYGQQLTVEFLQKIRDIRRFENVEELQKQLELDLKAIR